MAAGCSVCPFGCLPYKEECTTDEITAPDKTQRPTMVNDDQRERGMLTLQLHETTECEPLPKDVPAMTTGPHRSSLAGKESPDEPVGLAVVERIARDLEAQISRLLDTEEPKYDSCRQNRPESVLQVVIETAQLVDSLGEYLVNLENPHHLLKYLEGSGVELKVSSSTKNRKRPKRDGHLTVV
jgi:hypothetical protein